MEIILKSEQAMICFDKVSNSVVTVWKKTCEDDAFWRIIDAGISALKKFEATGYILDLTLNQELKNKCREAYSGRYLADLVQSKLRRIVAVFPEIDLMDDREVFLEIKPSTKMISTHTAKDLISAQAWMLGRENELLAS